MTAEQGWLWAGITLNFVGVVCSGAALLKDGLSHGHAISERWNGTKRWLRRHRHPRNWFRRFETTPISMSGGVAFGSALRDSEPPVVPTDPIEVLRAQVEQLEARHHALSRRLASLGRAWAEAENRRRFDAKQLRADLKDVAVGSLSLQLWGVVLVGLGSLATAVSALS